jgi:hypothetical protein
MAKLADESYLARNFDFEGRVCIPQICIRVVNRIHAGINGIILICSDKHLMTYLLAIRTIFFFKLHSLLKSTLPAHHVVAAFTYCVEVYIFNTDKALSF